MAEGRTAMARSCMHYGWKAFQMIHAVQLQGKDQARVSFCLL